MKKKQIKGLAAAVGYFALYACMMLVLQSLFTVATMGVRFEMGTRNQGEFEAFAADNLLITVLLAVISVGIIFYFIFRRRGIRREWRINPFTLRSLSLSVLVAFAYSTAFSLLSNLISQEENPLFRSVDYYSGLFPGLGVVLLMLNIFIAAPAVEEIVMRGVVYTRIDNSCGKWAAIIVSSLMFGLMHIAAGGLVLAVGAILMGLIFALIFAKTNSLTVCIIAHAVANIPDFVIYLSQ